MEEQFITNTLNKHNINSSVFIYGVLILSGILEYVAWFGHQCIFKKGEFKKKVAFGVSVGLIRYITLIIALIYAILDERPENLCSSTPFFSMITVGTERTPYCSVISLYSSISYSSNFTFEN